MVLPLLLALLAGGCGAGQADGTTTTAPGPAAAVTAATTTRVGPANRVAATKTVPLTVTGMT